MTKLLLITDVPRLRKVFSRLRDEKDLELRIANSLEKGGEEIVADKPAVVFVQTHLSGLSADIILMHLKKQLGRRRSRFVLLSAPSQVGADTVKLFHGHIDTSLDDKAQLAAIRLMLAGFFPQKKWAGVEEAAPAQKDTASPPAASPVGPAELPTAEPPADLATPEPAPTGAGLPAIAPPPEPVVEPSLVEQGVTYAPRSRVKVYSEFTSSFDSAVGNLEPPEPAAEAPPPSPPAWDLDQLEQAEPGKKLSKRASFVLWVAPVLIAAVVVTIIQNRKPGQKPVEAPVVVQQQKAPPAQPAQAPPAEPPKAAAPTAKPANEPGDKAVLSAIEQSRPRTEAPAPAGPRLTQLPDVVPRYGFDKKYGVANPGWERYMGQVTEFKVFRENGTIKTIQVIDRGGHGVPEDFMRAVLRQVAKNSAFVAESSEKKEGYEIQRGHVAPYLKVVFYRDEQGGRLRAFAMTWQ